MTQARYTWNLNPKSANALDDVTEREQETKTEAVNRAVRIYDLISRLRHDGVRFCLEHPDGTREDLRII